MTGDRLAVFLNGKGWWVATYRTSSGFRHVELCRVTGATREQAEARADELELRPCHPSLTGVR